MYESKSRDTLFLCYVHYMFFVSEGNLPHRRATSFQHQYVIVMSHRRLEMTSCLFLFFCFVLAASERWVEVL